MATERKFGFKLNNSDSNIGSAADELRKIESKKDFDFKVIPIEKIIPNPKNDYPMEDIEKLYRNIKRLNKLLTPLRVKPVEDHHLIIAGERRFRAISMGIANNDPEFEKFKVGIPCMVEDKNLDEVDEEIQLITENEEKRELDVSRRRRMVARLEELYKMKNMDTGDIKSVPKQIAEDLNIGERQVQRYNAVNNKLIPKLQEAFDSSKINLEKAAQFAAMDETTQELIAEILDESKEVTKNQLDAITQEAKNTEKKLKEKVEKSEDQNENFTSEEKEKQKTELEIRTIINNISKQLQKLINLKKKYEPLSEVQDLDDLYKNTLKTLESLNNEL